MGKAGAGKRSEKRPLLQTGIGKALFGLLVLAVACAGGYWFWQSQQPDTFYYRNMEMTALDGVERNTYIPQAFVQGENGWISYPDALQGVDVSVYQGEIDWQAVADAGVDFAIIRVGYRGYSQGAIQPDTNFQKNMEGALKAGLDVGVYFFSQATTVREAEEEADYVLEAIRNYPVTYPVVFDWEFIDGQQARTDEIDGERRQEGIPPWSTSTRSRDTCTTNWTSWTNSPSGWRSTMKSLTFSITLPCGSIPIPGQYPVFRAT